jgi:hypothetical protein
LNKKNRRNKNELAKTNKNEKERKKLNMKWRMKNLGSQKIKSEAEIAMRR